jgi:hypothetical protein
MRAGRCSLKMGLREDRQIHGFQTGVRDPPARAGVRLKLHCASPCAGGGRARTLEGHAQAVTHAGLCALHAGLEGGQCVTLEGSTLRERLGCARHEPNGPVDVLTPQAREHLLERVHGQRCAGCGLNLIRAGNLINGGLVRVKIKSRVIPRNDRASRTLRF